MLGYFVGCKLGGCKFWLLISLKKIWSGMLVGWVGVFVLVFGLLVMGEVLWLVLLIGLVLVIVG